MADKKISQLTDSGALQTGDLFVIARSGQNYKATGARVVRAGQVGAASGVASLDADSLVPRAQLPASLDEIALDAFGLTSWSYSVLLAGNGQAVTSGAGSAIALPLKEGDLVTNLHLVVATAGAGTAPTTIKLALTDAAGTRKAITANQAANPIWTSNGYKSVPVTTPYTVEADGIYMVCHLQVGTWGTTQITFGRAVGIPGTGYGALNGIYPYANFGTGLSDINASLTFSSSNNPYPLWCAVS